MKHSKTARAAALTVALIAGTSLIAPVVVQAQDAADASAMSQTDGPTTTGADVVTSLADKFAELDTNNDDLLSASEARADATVGSAYESFDTGQTIEQSEQNARPGGITRAQFEAGMQAAARSGAIGPPVSGGETYKVYPDGTMERVKGSEAAAQGKSQPDPSNK